MADILVLLSEDDPLLSPKAMLDDLKCCGLGMSKSWYEKLHADGKGPPVDCYWGRTPMRKRSTGRKWAQERMEAETKKRAV